VTPPTQGFIEPLPGFRWMSYKDGRQALLAPLVYVSKDGERFEVPAGFVTDYASIPSIFWNIPGFDPYGPAKFPAVLHDWLYSLRGGEPHGKRRAQCDALFLEAMQSVGVGWLHRRIIWAAVRLCGGLWSMSQPWAE